MATRIACAYWGRILGLINARADEGLRTEVNDLSELE
jgi:hypothetical protein